MFKNDLLYLWECMFAHMCVQFLMEARRFPRTRIIVAISHGCWEEFTLFKYLITQSDFQCSVFTKESNVTFHEKSLKIIWKD